MAKVDTTINLTVTKYRVIFFPVASYSEAGDVSRLVILGFCWFNHGKSHRLSFLGITLHTWQSA